MITIEKSKKKLLIRYSSDYTSPLWIDKELESKNEFTLGGVFFLSGKKLHKRIEEHFDEPEFLFVIGELIDNEYYKIDKDVFWIERNIYFHKSLPLKIDHFIVTSKISLLKEIDKVIKSDIYIGGGNEDILPFNNFVALSKLFPTTHEIKLYRKAKVSSVLRDYFDNIADEELAYKNYLNRKIPTYESTIRKTFKAAEILKFESLHERLKFMLHNEISYTEKQWQKEIIEIILLLFPKYIAVFEEVNFHDVYSQKIRRLDYGVIDFMGNLDIVEIKIPFEKNIVSQSKYRDNHIPSRDLSGSIMQIEKYIFYLNKSGKELENKLTQKYRDQLPEDLEIRITNPNAIIIMGRDKNLDKNQLMDFEIIKRKYKNVIDIFTYDDLLRRLDLIILQLKKI